MQSLPSSLIQEKCRDAVVVDVFPSTPHLPPQTRYTVGFNTQHGIVKIQNVVPSHLRCVPDDMNLIPARKGDPVDVTWCGNQMLLTFQERPDFGDCGTGGTP